MPPHWQARPRRLNVEPRLKAMAVQLAEFAAEPERGPFGLSQDVWHFPIVDGEGAPGDPDGERTGRHRRIRGCMEDRDS